MNIVQNCKKLPVPKREHFFNKIKNFEKGNILSES